MRLQTLLSVSALTAAGSALPASPDDIDGAIINIIDALTGGSGMVPLPTCDPTPPAVIGMLTPYTGRYVPRAAAPIPTDVAPAVVGMSTPYPGCYDPEDAEKPHEQPLVWTQELTNWRSAQDQAFEWAECDPIGVPADHRVGKEGCSADRFACVPTERRGSHTISFTAGAITPTWAQVTDAWTATLTSADATTTTTFTNDAPGCYCVAGYQNEAMWASPTHTSACYRSK